MNNANAMLDLSRSYRLEVEREEKTNQQKAELKSEISSLDQKIDRLEKVLKEQQNSYHDLNAESKLELKYKRIVEKKIINSNISNCSKDGRRK